jgi:hypothetical protein
VEGVGRLLAQVGGEAADSQVHRHQPPGGRVGFLPVDADVVGLAAVASMNFSLCTNMPPEPQHGS